MQTVSQSIDARSRKNEAAILHALAEVGQVHVAARLNCDESTISRMKKDDIRRMAVFIAACGMKVVHEDQECYDPGYLGSLRRLLSVELARDVPTSGFTPLDYI